MEFEGKTVLITGTNRGIGKALVEACLKKKAKKIYACSRQLQDLPAFNDPRVIPIELDVLNLNQIKRAAANCKDAQILINNAGTINAGNILEGDIKGLKEIWKQIALLQLI